MTRKRSRNAARRTLFLLADAGATHARAVVANPEGTILGRGHAGPANPFAAGEQLALQNLLRAARRALTRAGISGGRIASAVVGSAGVDFDGSGSVPIQAALRRLLPAAQLLVVTDSLIALEGALLGAPGVVIVSGTGSVVLARNQHGEVAKVGGWGPLLGDEGSAQWVAREALRAAARAADGTGRATSLTGIFQRRFGLRSFDRIIHVVYEPGMTPAELGALAPLVTRAARRGDGVARGIFRRGAQGLAEQAAEAIRRARLRGARVSYQGAMFRAGALFVRPLARALRERAPQARLVVPRASPLAGAWLLALRNCGMAPSPAAMAACLKASHV